MVFVVSLLKVPPLNPLIPISYPLGDGSEVLIVLYELGGERNGICTFYLLGFLEKKSFGRKSLSKLTVLFIIFFVVMPLYLFLFCRSNNVFK